MQRPPNSNDLRAGYSFLEVLFVISVTAILAAIAVPRLLATLDDFRTQGAVRYMSSRLQRIRMEAIVRSANVAMRFMPDGSTVGFVVYQDGNGNGVLASDIQNGVDREIQGIERLSENFVGVDFGTVADLPAVDGASTPPGSDPVRLGLSDMASFTALGTSTSGSLYIRGRRDTQYAIRILGETGKTRVLKFDAHGRRWRPI